MRLLPMCDVLCCLPRPAAELKPCSFPGTMYARAVRGLYGVSSLTVLAIVLQMCSTRPATRADPCPWTGIDGFQPR